MDQFDCRREFVKFVNVEVKQLLYNQEIDYEQYAEVLRGRKVSSDGIEVRLSRIWRIKQNEEGVIHRGLFSSLNTKFFQIWHQ